MPLALTPERWKELAPLVDAALDVAPERRQAFVANARAGDETLIAELRQLLALAEREDPLLERPAPELFASMLEDDDENAVTALGAALAAALAPRYRVERELGRGGMGIVYLAYDAKHDRRVAVKVLRPVLGAVLGADRFLREIAFTARLTHPNILTLIDSGEADAAEVGARLLYYVTPYVRGESLRDRLQRETRLPVTEAVRIAREVAGALDHAHRNLVLHRDVKPENILLQEGQAVVADFGIARAITAAGENPVTTSGVAVGTAAYMSPEQAAGDAPLDGRSDVYSLGCVLYEMLAGQPPFTGPTTQTIITRRLVDPMPSLRAVRDAVPEPLERAVRKALGKVPADRFPTARDFSDALRAALDAAPAAEPTGPRAERRVTIRAGVLAFGAAGALALGGWAMAASRSRPPAAAASPSIALLPCEAAGRDSAQAQVADRWTEELIDRLYRVADLRPKSSLAVQRYRATSLTSREIGVELGAATLARCRVSESAENVRLSIQLIRADDDQVVWSNEYARPMSAEAINAVQIDAAREIAQVLGAAPSLAERARLDRPLSRDLEALRSYRLARHFATTWTVGSLDRSIEFYRRAIARDSSLGHAYTGLAEQLVIVGEAQLQPGRLFCPEVARLALKALEIDGTIAEGHTTLAWYLLNCAYDWPGAEREYRRAIQLSPLSAGVRTAYAMDLRVVGRDDSAIVQLARAIELEPTSAMARAHLVDVLAQRGRRQRALEELRAATELHPSNPFLHFVRGRLLLRMGMRDSAVAAFEKADTLYGEFEAPRIGLAHAYARAGQPQRAERALADLLQRSRRQPVDPTSIAVLHEALGNRAEAIGFLEHAYQERSTTLLWQLGALDAFDELRGDPRLEALRRRIGMDRW